MIDQKVSISVVICAYTEERWDNLFDALHSIQNQTVLPDEVIVVIDHNERLFDRVRQVTADFTVIENQYLPGLSGARNSGIERARGEIIAFMDEDAIADRRWLEILAAEYREPEVLGAGGAILPDWNSEKPSWFPAEFYWVVGCTYLGLPEQKTTVRNLIGCNMSFRREILTSIGGFREGIGRNKLLPLGCEETELCIRAEKIFKGRSFVYQPEAIVYHRVSQNRTSLKYFVARCFAEGLSKAAVTNFVGEAAGLANERGYTFRTLPKGFGRYFWEGLRIQEIAGFSRAMALMLGLFITTVGYTKGKLSYEGNNAQVSTNSLALAADNIENQHPS